MNKQDNLDVTVRFEGVTEAQAIALAAMFKEWESLINRGSSRNIGFFVDGDGNFRPKIKMAVSEELVFDKELFQVAVKEGKREAKIYDFDTIGFLLDKNKEGN